MLTRAGGAAIFTPIEDGPSSGGCEVFVGSVEIWSLGKPRTGDLTDDLP